MESSVPSTSASKRGIWLIGGVTERLTGSKLPSNRQVLSRFFYLHTLEKKTIQESATVTAEELLTFWAKARIPTRQKQHIINKIKEQHQKWQGLKKAATRRTETQQLNEDFFSGILDELCDVAHADALSLMNNEEDREFLLAQREKGRRGCLGGVDMKLHGVEKRRYERQMIAKKKMKREEDRASAARCQIVENEGSGSSDSSEDEKDVTYESRAVPKSEVKKPANIVSSDVASALDRTKVSDRNATFIIASVAKAMGHDPSQLALNKESVRQSRRHHRETAAREIKEAFNVEGSSGPLTVHWDGKILPALTGNENVDRLAVIVSGSGVMKLIGVPKIPSGTGEAQATAVFQLIDDWHLNDRIQFMCFDTTASNTGSKAGACTLLQQKLQKQLISMACRHHIHELIIAQVFNLLMGCSSGPTIKLFERFSQAWNYIDSSKIESSDTDPSVSDIISSEKECLIQFFRQQLQEFHPRDDYKELLQLALMFLGDKPEAEGFHINAPGAYHRARWMAKIIYSLKIYLCRAQFRLTAAELRGLQQFNAFTVKCYLKAWYTCMSPTAAPQNDLQLLQDLFAYRAVNKEVASAATKSFMRHLWYLSETLVGLAFFDSGILASEKVLMVAALSKPGNDSPAPRVGSLDESTISQLTLSDFVSQNTSKFFVAMQTNTAFLQEDPYSWDSSESYNTSCHRAQQLKVVNDAAERGVSLIQNFNSVITNQEEQKQYLLQVVERHRQHFPESKKSVIVKELCKN